MLRRHTTLNNYDDTYLDDLEFYEEQFSRTPRGQKVAIAEISAGWTPAAITI